MQNKINMSSINGTVELLSIRKLLLKISFIHFHVLDSFFQICKGYEEKSKTRGPRFISLTGAAISHKNKLVYSSTLVQKVCHKQK